MNGDMAGAADLAAPFLSILRMPPAVFQHCSVDVLRFAAFHGQQDFLHLRSCPEIEIAAHGLLAAGTSPRAAPSFFLFFHKITIFVQPSNRRGGFGSPCLGSSECYFKCNSDFPNLESDSQTHRFKDFGGLFSTSFQAFRNSPLLSSLTAIQIYKFILKKQNKIKKIV